MKIILHEGKVVVEFGDQKLEVPDDYVQVIDARGDTEWILLSRSLHEERWPFENAHGEEK